MTLWIANELFNTATTATEDLPTGIPKRKGHHLVSVWIWLLALFALSIFGAAMFAEPTITNIEEVIGLIQGQRDFEIVPV